MTTDRDSSELVALLREAIHCARHEPFNLTYADILIHRANEALFVLESRDRTIAAYKQAVNEQQDKCYEHINLTDDDTIEAKWNHRLNGLLNVKHRVEELQGTAK